MLIYRNKKLDEEIRQIDFLLETSENQKLDEIKSVKARHNYKLFLEQFSPNEFLETMKNQLNQKLIKERNNVLGNKHKGSFNETIFENLTETSQHKNYKKHNSEIFKSQDISIGELNNLNISEPELQHLKENLELFLKKNNVR